jgi:hypothetical protein
MPTSPTTDEPAPETPTPTPLSTPPETDPAPSPDSPPDLEGGGAHPDLLAKPGDLEAKDFQPGALPELLADDQPQ